MSESGALLHHQFQAMGGPASIHINTNSCDDSLQTCESCVTKVQALERRYSRFLSESLIGRLNRAAAQPVEISAEDAGLFNFVSTVHRESGGLFDPTACRLMELWDFRSAKVPDARQIDDALAMVGWQRVELEITSIRLPDPGMRLDLGGVVKEYAVDAALRIIRESGAEGGLVDLAGDVAAFGRPPDADGWSVGIRSPSCTDQSVVSVRLNDAALATSGDYARSFVYEGARYSHCVSPLTGWPVTGPASVSVLASQCLLAGATATVAMLHTETGAKTWLNSVDLPWLLIDQTRQLHGPLAG